MFVCVCVYSCMFVYEVFNFIGNSQPILQRTQGGATYFAVGSKLSDIFGLEQQFSWFFERHVFTVFIYVLDHMYSVVWLMSVCLRELLLYGLHHLKLNLVASQSGKNVSPGRRTFPVSRSTFGWWVTTHVGKPSAGGQPNKSTQTFIPLGR